MKRLDTRDPDVIRVLSSRTLSLKEMADTIGVKSIWNVCRVRKELGLPRLYSSTGMERAMTNRERKARYNAKRKAIGWKYLYQVKEEQL